jgi:hypothetical protein
MANYRVDFSRSTNETLLIMYTVVRRQIEASQSLGRAVTGPYAKRYVDNLSAEMERRGLKFEPIVWSSSCR